MYSIESPHKAASHGWLTACLVVVVALFWDTDSIARCLGSGDPVVDAAEEEIARNPTTAIDYISKRIAATDSSNRDRLAYLYLAKAIAHRMEGSDDQAALKNASRVVQGVPLGDPLNLNLRLLGLGRVIDEERAVATLETVARQYDSLPDGTAAKACIANQLSFTFSELGDFKEAFLYATRAYRLMDTSPDGLPRAEAASIIGDLVAEGHDYEYARQLHSEALDIYLRKGASDLASNELLLRGYINLADRDWENARADFLGSIEQARIIGNDYAISYAHLGICSAALDGQKIEQARSACRSAFNRLYKPGERMAFPAAALQAALLVEEGEAKQALELLDPLLSSAPPSRFTYDEVLALETRAEAYKQLGRYEDAYAELQRANARRAENDTAERQAQMNVTQARFQTQQLQDSLAEEQRQGDASQRLATAVIVGAGATLSLLTILVYSLLRHRKNLQRIAMSDVLTGLPNRRGIQIRGREAFEDARATGSEISLALIDLDNFKSCNDRFGHDAGDEVLQAFAKLAQEAIRPGDAIGRWGGEEFLLLLPNSSTSDGVEILERLRRKARAISIDAAPAFELGFSAGVAGSDDADERLADLLKLADQRLYRAKALGRNRTCVDDDPQRAAG